MNMSRRFMISGLMVLPALSEAQSLTAVDKADLTRVSSYLDGISSMKARFVQISTEGVKSSGQMILARPGKIRFQYDLPSPYLLVAGFGEVTFYDKELNQTTKIPTSSTPLGILLEPHITFDRDIKVESLIRADGKLFVKLFRPKETKGSPKETQDGFITLILESQPMKLIGWVVTDQQRQNTKVEISNVELGGRFSDDLFRFEDPRFKNNKNN